MPAVWFEGGCVYFCVGETNWLLGHFETKWWQSDLVLKLLTFIDPSKD